MDIDMYLEDNPNILYLSVVVVDMGVYSYFVRSKNNPKTNQMTMGRKKFNMDPKKVNFLLHFSRKIVKSHFFRNLESKTICDVDLLFLSYSSSFWNFSAFECPKTIFLKRNNFFQLCSFTPSVHLVISDFRKKN